VFKTARRLVLINVATTLPPTVAVLLPRPLRLAVKEEAELAYWRGRFRVEKNLDNSHYQYFYTALFGLSADDYRGRRVLDIGCGPRGSLEWADVAGERVGLDPLADRYRELGTDRHKMTYVRAPSEAIPFADEYFDIVTGFNSLDHVDNFQKSTSEIHRVLKRHGRFLLIVEVNHPPTSTEPASLEHDALRARLSEKYEIVAWSAYDMPGKHDIYGAIRNGTPRKLPPLPGISAIVVASLVKQ
jgi:SAM-dependent methyltransferase